jgi:hypothetical protein
MSSAIHMRTKIRRPVRPKRTVPASAGVRLYRKYATTPHVPSVRARPDRFRITRSLVCGPSRFQTSEGCSENVRSRSRAKARVNKFSTGIVIERKGVRLRRLPSTSRPDHFRV